MVATACAGRNMNRCLSENSNLALQLEILNALPALVWALVQLGHTPSVAMMAQGIEAAEQLDALRRLGRELGRATSSPIPCRRHRHGSQRSQKAEGATLVLWLHAGLRKTGAKKAIRCSMSA